MRHRQKDMGQSQTTRQPLAPHDPIVCQCEDCQRTLVKSATCYQAFGYSIQSLGQCGTISLRCPLITSWPQKLILVNQTYIWPNLSSLWLTFHYTHLSGLCPNSWDIMPAGTCGQPCHPHSQALYLLHYRTQNASFLQSSHSIGEKYHQFSVVILM